MTEKRFELRLCSNGTYYLWNNNELTDIDFDKFNKESANEVINLLNQLNEENERLKNVMGHNYVEHKRCVNNYVDKIKEVEKENKQLKKDRFICLDCEHSGYTEIGCLCEKEDCWTEYKSDCENFKELKE